MTEVIRKRTIRPSTRKETSVNYRIHLDGLAHGDMLIINITHESKPFQKSFRFKASEVLKKKSLGFKVVQDTDVVQIQWMSTQPLNG
ncbi:hypothetical protein [Flavobacterium longum]|uniref:hypothetical protein n=1 Tax=Flavobacterium longum TaxID=1299340 RepID=UPI0039EC1215